MIVKCIQHGEVWQTGLGEHPGTIFQGEIKSLRFQESGTLGPTSRTRSIYKLDVLELTPGYGGGIFSPEMLGINRADVSNLAVREGLLKSLQVKEVSRKMA